MVVAALIAALLLPGPEVGIASGDEAFYGIDYPLAIRRYEATLGDYPGDADLLWRLARVYVCTGEVAGEGDREGLFKSAEHYARHCIEVDSLKPEGHTWLAGALGYIALHENVGRQISLSEELHAEARRALALNPNDDAAYSILGSFYRALGNVGWFQRSLASLFLGYVAHGGYDEAETALKQAILIAPEIMRHRYELGILYIDMGRRTDARRLLQEASQLPVRSAIDRPRLEKIGELLRQLEGAN